MKLRILYPIFLLLVLLLSCSFDHGLEPVKSAIKGEIVFTGEWPAPPLEVRIVSATKFPLAKIDDLDLGESIPDDVDSYSYTYYLKPGEYKMVGVAWREAGGSWEFTSVCGLYFTDGDSLNPGVVTLPTDTSIVRGIDMAVDRSRARRASTSQITGTVRFSGAWPDSFSSAIVMASGKDPLRESISILDMSYSAPITRGTEEVDYAINVAVGHYKSQGVIFFKKDAPIVWDDLYYSQNIGGLVVQDLDVEDNETVEGPVFNLNIGPITSAVAGTIQFSGNWPAPVDEVRMVALVDFPPTIEDMIVGELIPPDAAVHHYRFDLRPDTYKMVGVAWREAGGSWEFTSVCGLYFTDGDSLNPGIVAIPTDTSIVRGIDMAVDRSRARRASTSEITGTVNFYGAWPDSFTSAIVMASPKDPLLESFSVLDMSYSAPIVRGTEELEYSIHVASGLYKAQGVIFFKENAPLVMDDLYYTQNIGGLVIEDLNVGDNETVEGPDFNLEIGPINSAITGTIQFTGEWPETAEEIRIVASTVFPPAMEDMIVGEELPADAGLYSYRFDLRPDTYKIVGVVWRAEGTQFDLLSVCGVYFAGTDTLAPSTVVIPNDTSLIQDINIRVNRSKARVITDSRITGSITFTGEWPADITEMRVIASTRFSLFPLELPSLFDLSFSGIMPTGVDSVHYVIKAFPATYVATGVIFFREGQTLSINDILYSAEVNGLDMSEYSVEKDSTVTGPDFEIEF